MQATNPSPQPWYREPWPWILMGLPLTAVIAGFTTLAIAIRSNDGLVEDDYYTQGLAINRTIARDELAANMGLLARMNVRDGQIELQLNAREGVKLPEQVRLHILHPTRAGEDEVLSLVRGEGSLYRAKLPASLQGVSGARRTLVLEDEANSWRLNSEVRFGKGEAVIGPMADKSVAGHE